MFSLLPYLHSIMSMQNLFPHIMRNLTDSSCTGHLSKIGSITLRQ